MNLSILLLILIGMYIMISVHSRFHNIGRYDRMWRHAIIIE